LKIRINTKPISVNKAYPSALSGRRFLSKEGKAYKELIAWEAKSQQVPCNKGQVRLAITFGFADKRKRDTENYLKISIDALTGIWFDDDSQIIEIIAKKVVSADYFVEIAVVPCMDYGTWRQYYTVG
jgi:Holliday junction resolvase RusA-like endonuclease